jgi:hypothetical protein
MVTKITSGGYRLALAEQVNGFSKNGAGPAPNRCALYFNCYGEKTSANSAINEKLTYIVRQKVNVNRAS